MHPPLASPFARGALVALALFGTLSSLIGAVMGVVANGAGVPLEYLIGTPFTSYAVPGVILGVIVGGTQLSASIALLRHHPSALLLSAIAGFGMLIWTFVELAMLGHYSWLQGLYFTHGALEVVFVLALLGISPNIVAPAR